MWTPRTGGAEPRWIGSGALAPLHTSAAPPTLSPRAAGPSSFPLLLHAGSSTLSTTARLRRQRRQLPSAAAAAWRPARANSAARPSASVTDFAHVPEPHGGLRLPSPRRASLLAPPRRVAASAAPSRAPFPWRGPAPASSPAPARGPSSASGLAGQPQPLVPSSHIPHELGVPRPGASRTGSAGLLSCPPGLAAFAQPPWMLETPGRVPPPARDCAPAAGPNQPPVRCCVLALG
mmetsp:Transcript_108401/g.258696  ORF Transcript_108401/g.258696 Transcript_108401/m.258696 type:complete len:234 (-) Transcript_108401:63-764(-)